MVELRRYLHHVICGYRLCDILFVNVIYMYVRHISAEIAVLAVKLRVEHIVRHEYGDSCRVIIDVTDLPDVFLVLVLLGKRYRISRGNVVLLCKGFGYIHPVGRIVKLYVGAVTDYSIDSHFLIEDIGLSYERCRGKLLRAGH